MPAPLDPIKRELWLKKLSLAHKGKKAWNKGIKMPLEFRLKMGGLSNKFWTDPANKEKIKLRNQKIAYSKLGDKNPMKRPEVCLKASLSMKGRLLGNLNPSRRTDVRTKISRSLMGHTFSTETREKISKTLTGKLVGELNPFYGKKHTLEVKEKSRARAINMITSGLLSSRRTEIELKIKEALLRTNLKFEEQIPLKEVTVVDFYLPEYGIVIYCDGDYWHRGEWAKKHKVPNKDKWQTKILENSGHKVFRFSETEINNSADQCINLVKNHIYSLF
ncbi:MAG: DUF559 domain-containing protein [Candidatus Colwellbacteria bacterium]|nr:DUF559 domain-containing protein [Candidatus Colwellbacteria bacterium]